MNILLCYGVTMGKELFAAALKKAGTKYALAKALGESHQLVLHWSRAENGPPSWRYAQLRAYLEADSKPAPSSEAAA